MGPNFQVTNLDMNIKKKGQNYQVANLDMKNKKNRFKLSGDQPQYEN